MKKYFCNGKKDFCENPDLCVADCQYCDGSGGEYWEAPMTNAQKIRAMSDEELATMLKDYKDCSKNCIISNGKHCYQICEEESVLLKWLQQPVEEDDHG